MTTRSTGNRTRTKFYVRCFMAEFQIEFDAVYLSCLVGPSRGGGERVGELKTSRCKLWQVQAVEDMKGTCPPPPTSKKEASNRQRLSVAPKVDGDCKTCKDPTIKAFIFNEN